MHSCATYQKKFTKHHNIKNKANTAVWIELRVLSAIVDPRNFPMPVAANVISMLQNRAARKKATPKSIASTN